MVTEALRLYRNKLSEYEQTEILDYPEIWFLGLDANKLQARQGSGLNHGYDDENGSYLKVWIERDTCENVNVHQSHMINHLSGSGEGHTNSNAFVSCSWCTT